MVGKNEEANVLSNTRKVGFLLLGSDGVWDMLVRSPSLHMAMFQPWGWIGVLPVDANWLGLILGLCPLCILGG